MHNFRGFSSCRGGEQSRRNAGEIQAQPRNRALALAMPWINRRRLRVIIARVSALGGNRQRPRSAVGATRHFCSSVSPTICSFTGSQRTVFCERIAMLPKWHTVADR